MYKNLVAINKEINKDEYVKEVKDFSYAKNQMSAPITGMEFYEVCKNYPIFFSKDEKNDWFALALLGYRQNINEFVDEKGEWAKLHYVPAFFRKYPFIFVQQENKDESLLVIEKDYLSQNKKDKDRKLFDEKGENSEFLNNVLTFLNKFQIDAKNTSDFIKQLDEWELLEEKIATVNTVKKEQFNINGFYVINENKLKDLSDDKKLKLFENNIISLISAHLISLSNIQKFGI